MELSIARRLAELNQRFYAEHAENFADSRPRLAAGVQRVLAAVPGGRRILELGCGDGKVGRALSRAGAAAYLGLDLSDAMLARARRYSAGQPGAGAIQFLLADLASADWTAALPPDPFDWALAFAVFHHLPGRALRGRVLREMAAHVRPGGRVVMSNWRFDRSPRLMQRVAGWQQAGLEAADLEPGDYLLTWQRGGQSGLRYVHALESAEARQLAAQAGLQVIESFSADGASRDLSEYVLMQRDGD